MVGDCRSRLGGLLAVAISVFGTAPAGAQDLAGYWQIEATGFAFNGAPAPIDLLIEDRDGDLAGWIYNGPVALRSDGDSFEIDLDWATPFDTTHVSTLRGQLIGPGEIEGEVTHNGDENFLGDPMPGGRFHGLRTEPRELPDDSSPQPVDLSGEWNRAFGQWPVRKLDYAMTPKGQAVIDRYMEMDNPNSRCASMGLIMAAGMPYPMEIANAGDHLLIVYGADYVRRVYLDNREFPDTETSSSLGFSTGEWHGDTLVVKTTHLTPAFMSTRGQPVSENAHTIEHFYLDDKGYLHADMWLHDPDNYQRPPYLRRTLDRNFAPTVITKVGCDPYSFFRALYLDGNLEEFWGRAGYRR